MTTPRRRRCLNWKTCKRHATARAAYCGPCYWRAHDRTLMRALDRLKPGESLNLGGGWSIVKRGAATPPMPRRQPDLIDD